MTDLTNVELGLADRPNRFQVNPVTQAEKRRASQQAMYSVLPDSDGEIVNDDRDPEDASEILQRRKPSIKSSIRDKDKMPRFKDAGAQTTRFQVDSDGKENSDSEDEDRELIGNESDPRYVKSFRHFTREALPRLDNYRNILSIQAQYRPTLDELHNATITGKIPADLYAEIDQLETQSTLLRDDSENEKNLAMFKFGWIKGVLMRCLLNIWGVMLFLRLSWVVGQAGVAQGIILILVTTVVTTITALSMSAISTNGVIKGGGTYYMISRSLGPEFGGSIGLIFSLANAVACAMYVVGFCESMNDLLKTFGVSIIDGGTHDVRIIGSITLLLLLGIVVIGLEWEAKAQIGLLVILLAAIADFVIGSLIGPKSDEEFAKGYLGYNSTTFMSNLWPDYKPHGGVEHNFFTVLAIFFPAATGILAGANISGDLRDPQKSIPKGTILAIIITSFSYVAMAIICGSTVVREATGNLTLALNGSWEFLDCENHKCEHGLHYSFQVIQLVSIVGPFIFAGCFAATLSSALASLVSAPKVFQALCKDRLYPKIEWFGKGYGKTDEPVRGYVLTFFIGIAFILIGDLNTIAPVISNFFLAAYALINFSTFHASLAKPVGWRPTFKYYNMWLSLGGGVLSVAVMFLISWWTALLTFAVIIALYLCVSYRKPDVNWGSTTQAQTYKNALLSVQQLNHVEEHVKNYRPQILVLSGLPNTRPILIDFAYLLTKNLSLLVCGHIYKAPISQKYRNYLQKKANEWLQKHKVKGFFAHVDDQTFESGARALMSSTGIGKLKPNIVLMGYKADWETCDRNDLEEYFNVVHKALDMYLSVAILRVGKGLDYSNILGEEVPKNIHEIPRTMQANESSADLMKHNISGSCDSLSRNVSQDKSFKNGHTTNDSLKVTPVKQASSISDITATLTNMRGDNVSGLPDPFDARNKHNYSLLSSKKGSRNSDKDPATLYKGPGGADLPKDVLNDLTIFDRKHKNAVIDVWWLYDDGGLSLLLPYIISTRRNWSSCKLRVFALANKKAELEFEQRSMASLLAKFRIDYSDLQLIPDITKKPQEHTQHFFNNLIKNFVNTEIRINDLVQPAITDADLLAVQDKTNRHLRLREYLLENSQKSDLVVMTLPMPRKSILSAPLYMAWLECLSQGLPPFLFVRGNQSSVLTFYS